MYVVQKELIRLFGCCFFTLKQSLNENPFNVMYKAKDNIKLYVEKGWLLPCFNESWFSNFIIAATIKNNPM